MAERRMFAKTIVLSDAFLDMPMSARCLYFTLGMFADDDGFVNSPKAIMRQCGATDDDMKILVAKKFVLLFDSGVIVIKHWRINNYLRNDRYVETKHIDEKSLLGLEENGTYKFLEEQNEDFGIPGGIPNMGIPSIGKDSIDKNSINNKPFNKLNGMSDSSGVRRDITTVFETWNASLTPLGFSKLSKMSNTSKRYTMLNARIHEYGLDEVLRAIENVKNSKYLRDQTWFTFDWFIKPNNFPKVLEGNYNKGSDSNDIPCSKKDDPWGERQ